ncbi:unnamed protein product [Arabidopsis thaliana]|uniref:(thale cress) hypothetical protein n=1 Tax=Arabidopsis thaliana TaxID=3702 RepID=A0A7G2F5Q7_ARATH|nr:unnamed protein product [Arabidopsis thaliana]
MLTLNRLLPLNHARDFAILLDMRHLMWTQEQTSAMLMLMFSRL